MSHIGEIGCLEEPKKLANVSNDQLLLPEHVVGHHIHPSFPPRQRHGDVKIAKSQLKAVRKM